MKCEEHNLKDCGICHREHDQCSYGSCQSKAQQSFRHKTGRDFRRFCGKHATSPMYAFARAGFERV